jgi:hypothetical protein
MAGVITGNVQSMSVVTVTLSPAAVAANTTAEQTFTVPGVLAADFVLSVVKPTAQAGLGIVGWRVSALNTVGITFSNNTAASITPTASQSYVLLLARPDSTQAGFNV